HSLLAIPARISALLSTTPQGRANVSCGNAWHRNGGDACAHFSDFPDFLVWKVTFGDARTPSRESRAAKEKPRLLRGPRSSRIRVARALRRARSRPSVLGRGGRARRRASTRRRTE